MGIERFGFICFTYGLFIGRYFLYFSILNIPKRIISTAPLYFFCLCINAASEISIPSCTLLSLFSNVSSTNSRTLSSIFPGSVILNSFTVLFSALLHTTLTNAPGTPWPVQSAAAIKYIVSGPLHPVKISGHNIFGFV